MKKFAILVLTIVLSFQFASAQSSGYNRDRLLKGEMTYSAWTGKMTIGGIAVSKGSESKYFNESELKKFKSATTVANIGGCLVGAAIGYPLGYTLGGGELKKETKTVLCIMGGLGVVLTVAGSANVQKVVKEYNLRQKSGSEVMNLSLLANPAGVGMILSF